MDEVVCVVLDAVNVLGVFAKWFFGETDNLMSVMIVFVFLNLATGIIRTVINKSFCWSKLWLEIYKKLLMFALIGISNIVDKSIPGEIGVLRTSVILFYLSTEGTSILENSDQIGLIIPDKLKQLIKILRAKGGVEHTDSDQ